MANLYKPAEVTSRNTPQLTNIVGVQFDTNHIKHDADAGELILRPGQNVIVEADQGPLIARVHSLARREMVKRRGLPRILRVATESDLIRHRENQDLERRAHQVALRLIKEHELPMKLVRAQSTQDRTRLLFYFCAEGRVDFRALVRDLAREFHTRIELVQIGVRDSAQMLGGIGPCGRELCCSTFLDRFQPISIRMAKDQGLTLNPSKISGMCGRLMCCLIYEQRVYRKMRRRLPRQGQTVDTPLGPARVTGVDVINQRVHLASTEDQLRSTLPLDQIRPLTDSGHRSSQSTAEDRTLWDGDPPRKRTPAVDES